MKPKTTGLTLVEILVVVGIIALLTGLLIPAVTMVTKSAKNAKQMAQFTAIELGLEAYKADFGEYPPSDPCSAATTSMTDAGVRNSAGAMKLSEAMLGWDLMGVHPDTGFRVDGKNRWPYTDSNKTVYGPGTYWFYDRSNTIEMQKRKGRYVELDVANPFQFGITAAHTGLYNLTDYGLISQAADCFVLCDVFGKGPDMVTNTSGAHKKAGRPILYYRANSANKFLVPPTGSTMSTAAYISTYSYLDNDRLVNVFETIDRNNLGMPRGPSFWDPLASIGQFNNLVADPRASLPGSAVAYRPDSYILISAGADGFYGTSDDICNFVR